MRIRLIVSLLCAVLSVGLAIPHKANADGTIGEMCNYWLSINRDTYSMQYYLAYEFPILTMGMNMAIQSEWVTFTQEYPDIAAIPGFYEGFYQNGIYGYMEAICDGYE